MKVLHVIWSMDPRHGGPCEFNVQLGRGLEDEGHTSEIVCIDSPDDPWVRESPRSIHAVGPRSGKYSYSSRFVPWLRGNIARYDCAIVNGVWCYTTLGTWLASRRTGTPYFLWTHGMLDPWFRGAFPLKHLKKSIYWKLVEHRVLRDARSVLFTSEEEQALAAQSFRPYHCRGAVVTNGVQGPSGDPHAQRRRFLDAFPGLEGKRLLLFISRVHPKKGCDLLIEAFGAVAGRHPDLHLVMAGPDETGWVEALRRRASALGVGERVTWTGMLGGDLKWGAFRAADAFVLPSHSENFGLVVVEALACGLPVLISRKVNIWRQIADDGAGIVADDDLPGTTDLLERWLSLDPAEIEAMVGKAYRCFEGRFHVRHTARRLIDTLRACGVRD